jgi:putative membrane protein
MTLQILRTALWVLASLLVAAFVWINWTVVDIYLVPGELNANDAGRVGVKGPLGVIILVAMVAGALPVWLLAKAKLWRLKRRIAGLENTLRAATPSAPIATATQLDAAADKN